MNSIEASRHVCSTAILKLEAPCAPSLTLDCVKSTGGEAPPPPDDRRGKSRAPRRENRKGSCLREASRYFFYILFFYADLPRHGRCTLDIRPPRSDHKKRCDARDISHRLRRPSGGLRFLN
ncbi:hypothetical protein PUN28_016683 [Cardiocondyla obscurior]|uniref:Uncharacterized protein n=1 Tax=Cardiocondyla obscurior TaxID=286306 RepID=A0AAW2EPG8_9HYME